MHILCDSAVQRNTDHIDKILVFYTSMGFGWFWIWNLDETVSKKGNTYET